MKRPARAYTEGPHASAGTYVVKSQLKGGFHWRSHVPCGAIEKAGHFMDDKPYMVSFVWMHVQISMAPCRSSVEGRCMFGFTCEGTYVCVREDRNECSL